MWERKIGKDGRKDLTYLIHTYPKSNFFYIETGFNLNKFTSHPKSGLNPTLNTGRTTPKYDLFIYVMYTYCCSICKSILKTSSIKLSKKAYPVCYGCQESGYKETQAKPRKAKRKSKQKEYYTYQDFLGRSKSRPYTDEYSKQVWILTENQPLNTLPGYDLRGWDSYHLDHIVPICYGRDNNIPPTYIASLENLRFIPSKQNMDKNKQLTEESRSLLNKWSIFKS